jgi:acyl-CoA synthetase (AMP-forming)/AMP-acid ligase II
MATGEVQLASLSLEEARPLMAAVVGSLAARGVEPGERVVFSLPSSPELLAAVVASSLAGIVPVVLNPQLTEAERALQLEIAVPSATVLGGDELEALLHGPRRPVELAPLPRSRPMLFTSGTTGRPKGVLAGPWDQATAAAVFADDLEAWAYEGDDVHLVNSPLCHSAPLRFATGTLLAGGRVLIPSRFDPTTVLGLLREGTVTSTFMVPTHLGRLFAAEGLGAEERFSSLRLLAHAGAACPPGTRLEALRRSPVGALVEFYGSTEGQFTICPAEEWLEHPGSVGRARPGRRLFSVPLEDEPEVDGVGVLWCEAPAFARFEYFGDPAATAAAWSGDAFSVGDLGTVDVDGWVTLVGRRQELIITGGVNVYPAEVERALLGVEGVLEAGVVGLEDEDWGQRVIAAVVLSDPSLQVEELSTVAARCLAPYKRPKEIHVLSELPHSPTGKLKRGELAALLAERS